MSDSTFTLFDLAVVAVILISALLSLVRGLVREALTVAAWLGAIAFAWWAFLPVQGFARETIETPWLVDAATLIIVFVLPLVTLKVLAVVLAEQLPEGWFGRLDRGLGAAFGALRGALIVCAGYLGLTLVMAPERQPEWVRDARSLPYVQDGAALLQRLLPAPATVEQALRGRGAQLVKLEA
jgi:membrane protein required for colicin V production